MVLSHCPKELEQELRNSTKWAGTECDQDVVALLLMIRDITHNKKERKESVMTTVESDVELFTIVQEQGQDLDDYYKVFKAQVDTIDAHGGNAGYHPVVYMLHLAALIKIKKITNDAYQAMTRELQKPLEAEAMKSSKGAYLACLFLLMADEDRYGRVKVALDDNYLLEKQEYPQDLLAAKRLLADFKGAGPNTKRKAPGSEEGQGVAFVERGWGGYIPTCHGCGNKCKGGWRRCPNITEAHRSKVAELDAAGVFRKKTDGSNSSNSKKGTVNTVAGEETDNASGGGTSDAKTEETTASDLTDPTEAPWPSYKELLQATGHINATVGVDDAIDGDYDSQGSWDGDDLASLGIGFLQVQGENQGVTLQDEGVTFLQSRDWHVQGHRGTNPVKSKRTVSSILKEGSV